MVKPLESIMTGSVVSPAATDIGHVASYGPCNKVEHAKDGGQVSSLCDGETKLGTQVRCQHVVNGKLQAANMVSGMSTYFRTLLTPSGHY